MHAENLRDSADHIDRAKLPMPSKPNIPKCRSYPLLFLSATVVFPEPEDPSRATHLGGVVENEFELNVVKDKTKTISFNSACAVTWDISENLFCVNEIYLFFSFPGFVKN